jgi:hypothetical protein
LPPLMEMNEATAETIPRWSRQEINNTAWGCTADIVPW